MKKALFSFLFLAFSVVAQPPWFPYGIPIGGSNESGDVVICDSSCQSSIGGGEGILYKPDQSTITSLPHGAVGQVLQSRGPGLPPVFTNPASIQAFVYGPSDSLVSNPQLANQAAKFIRVTDTTRIVAGSDFASAPILDEGTSRYVEVTQGSGIFRYDNASSGSTRWNGIVAKGYNGAPVYVRVGAGGAIASSTDGNSWTSRTSGTANNLNDVIYESFTGKFWAVGEGGTMLSSADGTTWSTVTLPGTVSADNLSSITTNHAGIFVVGNISTGNRNLQSLDNGVTWTTNSMGTNGFGTYSAHFSGGTFLLGCNTSGGSRLLTYSSNVAGGAWTSTLIPGGADIVFSITDDGTNWIASGTNGFIATAPLGVAPSVGNWTVRNSGVTTTLRVSALNGHVYAFGGASGVVRFSTDNGRSWGGGVSTGVSEVIRDGAPDPTNGRALLVGDNGTLLAGVYPLVISAYATSHNRNNKLGLGISSYSAGVSAAGSLRSWAYGVGLYVRVGLGGLIESSPDLTTWTTRTSGTVQNLNDIIWDHFTGKFWVVGDGGVMLSSTNGTTWSTVTLPGSVASDGLSAIATNGAGVFIVGNTSTGNRNLQSLNGGVTWTVDALGSSVITYSAHYDGTNFITGRGADAGGRFLTYSSDVAGGAWATVNIPGGADNINSITNDGVNRVISGTNGFVATSPLSTSPALVNWTVRTSGSAEGLRVFVANSHLYLVGGNGVSRTSSDNGETWVAGPAVGVTNFMHFGMSDPANPSRAIVVGGGSTMLIGQYPVAYTTYSNLPDSIVLDGSAAFNLDTLTASDIPLDIDLLRQFNSTAYASTADRSAGTSPLGNAFYTYTETPLVVTIPGEITFQIGILTPGEVPFDFDVVTIDDMIYNLFVVQNSALNPGPYYGWNAVYDFGVDDRFEFGAESDNEYATLIIQDSDTGDWFVKKSNAPGDAGDPITWVDAFIIRGNGAVSIPSLGVGSGAVCHTAGVLSECP